MTPIVVAPAEILTTKATRVDPTSMEALALAAELHETLAGLPHAAGVAANQIGSPLAMMIVRHELEGPTILSNPRIVEQRGKRTGWEGCLSLPDLYLVRRPCSVVVEAQDIVGDPVRLRAREFFARLLAHEVDHLEGRLIDAAALEVRERRDATTA